MILFCKYKNDSIVLIFFIPLFDSVVQCQSKEESRISVPLDVYRSIARYQSTFLDIVSVCSVFLYGTRTIQYMR